MEKQTTNNQPKQGEVFTRPEIVDYMLETIQHVRQQNDWSYLRVLEPSCGHGAFVFPLIDALIDEVHNWEAAFLNTFLRACDVSWKNILFVREIVGKKLEGAGCSSTRKEELLDAWFICDDFLTHDFDLTFDIVVGNPPYIRFDDLSKTKQQEYSRIFTSFSNRCDIYIPFFEKALSLLSSTGILCFICTNRFTKNRYGKKLRQIISDNYHVAIYINMEHAQPFLEKVSAYPAIFVIDKRIGLPTLATTVADTSTTTLEHISLNNSENQFSSFETWYHNGNVWTCTDACEQIELQRIESIYPLLEESASGTKIGIGVASGADDVFLDAQRNFDIEADRLMPLVLSEDIKQGSIIWRQHYILNPYESSGKSSIINLEEYPKTAAYFKSHAERLKSRYCAKDNPNEWFRTIDRINYNVFRSAKILLPDIQPGGNVALDEKGEYYPHHNVYWITSSSWNLKALCVILRSTFVTNQIRRVSVQLRGGNVRYQAQNLRNIHIPSWSSLSDEDVRALEALYTETDLTRIDSGVMSILSQVAHLQPRKLTQGTFF